MVLAIAKIAAYTEQQELPVILPNVALGDEEVGRWKIEAASQSRVGAWVMT